jgi:hypothetical protein
LAAIDRRRTVVTNHSNRERGQQTTKRFEDDINLVPMIFWFHESSPVEGYGSVTLSDEIEVVPDGIFIRIDIKRNGPSSGVEN